ncbi:hypothetical protein A3F66_04815 [candidate division TM6 bacterium RIFCSPHIGHO2_12_FULL_32_22]|nr:MAG: hypothetical protein A3F66_04815 [candidate division TM6 bacterium RIFCSPHIGHO2_12_FULL_32_22]
MWVESNSVIEIIFKIINFFIILFIIAYFFKKSSLPGIKLALQEKINYILSLRDKIKFNSSEIKKLDSDIEENKHEIQDLDDKLSSWSNSCILQKENEILSAQEIENLINDKRVFQQENFDKFIAKKTVIPKVIKESETELITIFKDEKRSKKYINDLLDFMRTGHTERM